MNSKITRKELTLFLVPSLIGVILFMLPLQHNGELTILVKILADQLSSLLGSYLPLICVVIISISAVFSLLVLLKVPVISSNKYIHEIFNSTPVWVSVRVVGAILVWITYLELDQNALFSMIIDGGSGGFVLHDLLTVLVIIFAIAGLFLPLLLDFGLLEFIGTLFTKIMRPLFKIPGRAAVDCVTSWLGDGTLGVILTNNQYEEGYYSGREAAIIATNFSAVSITFSIVVLSEVGLMEHFGLFYILVCLIGVVCAIICPRIPPLSRKKNSYLLENTSKNESIPSGTSSFSYGLALAGKRAKESASISTFFKKGSKNAFDMWFTVLPIVMTIGTLALVIANNTTIFEFLGRPFLPLLEFLGVPEAVEASKTLIVGFTDMFTPAIIAAESISSPVTLFIVAVVSVTQLIYLSEVGGLILGSKIPLKLWELFIIFIERTIISLLIVAPIAIYIFS